MHRLLRSDYYLGIVTLGLAIVGTVVLTFVVKAVIGLRPDAATEEAGLDDADHGEAGYHFDEAG